VLGGGGEGGEGEMEIGRREWHKKEGTLVHAR
jgi:hypothetical protein